MWRGRGRCLILYQLARNVSLGVYDFCFVSFWEACATFLSSHIHLHPSPYLPQPLPQKLWKAENSRGRAPTIPGQSVNVIQEQGSFGKVVSSKASSAPLPVRLATSSSSTNAGPLPAGIELGCHPVTVEKDAPHSPGPSLLIASDLLLETI
jgi:hypothetical protein